MRQFDARTPKTKGFLPAAKGKTDRFQNGVVYSHPSFPVSRIGAPRNGRL